MTNEIEIGVARLLQFGNEFEIRNDALKKQNGSAFNFFNIIKVGHLEVKTHSPILRELLNPKGSHGQGSVFLNLFLAQMGIGTFDSKTASSHLEYYAGPKTETTGGKIDILLVDAENHRIIIENKVHAGDQENQTLRYRNFDASGCLFYLTLDGKSPDNVTDVQGLRCISYRRDILAWLIACRDTVNKVHNLRESLNQYIHLIEELTDQNTSTLMNDEMNKFITQDTETLRAFHTLCRARDSVNWFLIEQLGLQLDAIASDLKVTRSGSLENFWKKQGGFSFSTPALTLKNLHLCFAFDEKGYRNFYFGFGALNAEIGCEVAEELQKAFSEKFVSDEPNAEWPAWGWVPEYQNLEENIYEEIRSGAFAAHIRQKLTLLLEIADRLRLNHL